jgi:hypothetical protein
MRTKYKGRSRSPGFPDKSVPSLREAAPSSDFRSFGPVTVLDLLVARYSLRLSFFSLLSLEDAFLFVGTAGADGLGAIVCVFLADVLLYWIRFPAAGTIDLSVQFFCRRSDQTPASAGR